MSTLSLSTNEVEFQLKQSQESLEFALQSARMGTWDFDIITQEIVCSEVMLNIWGVSAGEFDGNRQLLQSKVHPDDLDKMRSLIDEAIANKSIYELEYRIFPTPDNMRWVLSRGRPTYKPGSALPVRFAGIVHDITDRKMKEEELAFANRARDQFFMIASHELKTPLTSLQLQLHVNQWKLKHKYPESFSAEKIDFEYKKQKEQILRITRIIDNILDVSRISEGKLMLSYEQFDLCEMINGILEFFRFAAESNGVVVKFQTDRKYEGTWDRFRLEQVLLNLLFNAVRYGNKKPIHIEVAEADENVIMIVRDEGMGIREDLQHRVFKRFEGTISENETSGIGLGLYISHNIAIAHGGKINLKSELGKGSEFSVILPRVSNLV